MSAPWERLARCALCRESVEVTEVALDDERARLDGEGRRAFGVELRYRSTPAEAVRSLVRRIGWRVLDGERYLCPRHAIDGDGREEG